MFHIPIVVCGGGILGLLIAKELLKTKSADDIVLFEQNAFFGEGNTSRNSGVLHSGIYYETGSFKHQMCLKGNKMWRDLCAHYQINVNNCGKYIVAINEEEKKSLDDLRLRAKENNVEIIDQIESSELSMLGEYINISDGIYVPSTGILDVSMAIKEIEKDLFNRNLPLMKSDQLINLQKKDSGFLVETKNSGSFTCDTFINVAGLNAVKIRKMLGLNELDDLLVKGNYVRLKKKYYNDSLIYPIPQKNLKGLGVHTSFDIEGQVRFGPNTEDVDSVSFDVAQSIVEAMYPDVAKVFKGVKKCDLAPDYAGVRPKIKLKGELFPDFWIKNDKETNISGYFECCGIESPGLTAAPAIAEFIAEHL